MSALILFCGAPAAAQGIALVRDAEIEVLIRDYADPIFAAAGLDPQSIRIHLVSDDRLNAFVAGGQRIFIHTGLLIEARHPGQVISVIAHEAGHIAGGHLMRLQDELRNAEAKSIVAFVLGTAAAIAAGDPRVAGAVTVAGQQVALSTLLRYSRAQESAADLAALKYLDQTGQSAQGMLEFLQLMAGREAFAGGRENPYLRTHPLSRDRLAAIASHLSLSRYSAAPPPTELVARHARMRAKLVGFSNRLDDVLRIYPEADDGVSGRYARAIAYFRRGEIDRALPLIDTLLAEHPTDPYFHELKGQMLFENGRVGEALAPYAEAVRLAPGMPLLRIEFAQVAIELNDADLLPEATRHLTEALRKEPRMGMGWRLLVIAYGRQGEIGSMTLAQAELALLRGEREQAKSLAERAERALPQGSPAWLRAQDIRGQLD
ncbi:MAG: M48 family metalloprotease [Alphaproteobacteria bacterium]